MGPTQYVAVYENKLTSWPSWVDTGWGGDAMMLMAVGEIKSWCQACHCLHEQRWTMRTVRGGGWSVWMRWPPWRNSSLTWRSSESHTYTCLSWVEISTWRCTWMLGILSPSRHTCPSFAVVAFEMMDCALNTHLVHLAVLLRVFLQGSFSTLLVINSNFDYQSPANHL